MTLKWEFVSRYFSGHTKNPDGSVQFTTGKTKVGDAIDGAIKIITVAVCAMIITRACLVQLKMYIHIYISDFNIYVVIITQ